MSEEPLGGMTAPADDGGQQVASGPDAAGGQASNEAPPAGDGQLGEIVDETGGTTEEFQIPPEEEEAWNYLEKKGMTTAGLVKSYSEAEKKISEMGAELSMLRQMVARLPAQSQTYTAPMAQAAKPQGGDFDVEEFADLIEEKGAAGVAEAFVKFKQSMDRERTEQARRASEYSTLQPQVEQMAQQVVREKYGELPAEAKEFVQQISKENALLNMAMRGITPDNYDSYGPEGMKEVYAAAYELTHLAAVGMAAQKLVQKNNVEASRKAKESYFKKAAAGGRPAGASPKPKAPVAPSNSGFDLLEAAARATR